VLTDPTNSPKKGKACSTKKNKRRFIQLNSKEKLIETFEQPTKGRTEHRQIGESDSKLRYTGENDKAAEAAAITWISQVKIIRGRGEKEPSWNSFLLGGEGESLWWKRGPKRGKRVYPKTKAKKGADGGGDRS